MKKVYIISTLILILASGIFSCEKVPGNLDIKLDELPQDRYYESEIFDESNLDIYGKWELYDVSGGIHAGGHDLNFDYLEVRKFGIYGFIRDGAVLELGSIHIDEQGNEALLITFKPDKNSGVIMHDSEKFIHFFGIDTLSLDSPCCDRFNYHFKRVQ